MRTTTKDHSEEIDQFLKEHKPQSPASYAEYRTLYQSLVNKFGLAGVQFIERLDETNPIKDGKMNAAKAVAREWRVAREERLAKWTLVIAFAAALFSGLGLLPQVRAFIVERMM